MKYLGHQGVALDLQVLIAGDSQFYPECHCPRHSEEMSMELIPPLDGHGLRRYDSGYCWPSPSGPLLNDGRASLL